MNKQPPRKGIPGKQSLPEMTRRGFLKAVAVTSAGVFLLRTDGAIVPTAHASPATVDGTSLSFTLDPAARRQTVRGFGASGAWWSQYLGGWVDTQRNAVADLLFSRDKGIGLSQYRYNIGGGIDDTITDPWRTAETFETGPRTYDWSRDANARWFVQAAKDRGIRDLIAFVNSPSRRITKNGHTYGTPGQGSNLALEEYSEFAQYLSDILKHFKEKEGIDFRSISPINEPQWGWDSPGQEGCHYEPNEIPPLLRTVLDSLRSNGLKTEVLAPEAGEYKSLYQDQNYTGVILSDPVLNENLSTIAVHSYWSNDDQRRAAAQDIQTNYPGHTLTMTEWTEMVGGRDYGMDAALVLAQTVHSDMTIANVEAWQYWIAVSRYDYHDGLLYTDYVQPGDPETFEQTKKLWAMGNYSRYIRPGAVRIEATPHGGGGKQAEIPMVTPQLSPQPSSEGTVLFTLQDPAGDDNGPGDYTYPTNSVFTPGSFDLRTFQLVDAGDDLLFKLTIGADLYDPWNGAPAGYDIQIFDVYIDKDGGASGFTELLPGRRALMGYGHAWDLAIWATGRTDQAMQNVHDKVSPAMQQALYVPMADRQKVDGRMLTLRVPKSFVGQPQQGWSYQVCVLGSEGNMEADSLRAREVKKQQSDWQFGGGSDGHEDPNIIDLFTPDGVTQAQALAWSPDPLSEVFVSSYLSEHENKLIVVAINQGTDEYEVGVEVPCSHGPNLKLTPFRTSDNENLAKLPHVELKCDTRGGTASGKLTLAPRSVTTYTAPYQALHRE